jgi:hypothetical protein
LCKDIDKGCQRVLKAAVSSLAEHVFTDVLEHAELPMWNNQWTKQKKADAVFSSKIRITMRCVVHDCDCPIPFTDVNVSGLPCVDFAPSGLQRGIEGPTFAIFLTWVHHHRTFKTLLMFFENVPEFPVAMMEALLGDLYFLYWFYICPADAAFELLSRSRLVIYFVLRGLFAETIYLSPTNLYAFVEFVICCG